jgi:hypothetical protein
MVSFHVVIRIGGKELQFSVIHVCCSPMNLEKDRGAVERYRYIEKNITPIAWRVSGFSYCIAELAAKESVTIKADSQRADFGAELRCF